jgi:hypothetical protein
MENFDRLVALALQRQAALNELNYDVQQSAPATELSE